MEARRIAQGKRYPPGGGRVDRILRFVRRWIIFDRAASSAPRHPCPVRIGPLLQAFRTDSLCAFISLDLHRVSWTRWAKVAARRFWKRTAAHCLLSTPPAAANSGKIVSAVSICYLPSPLRIFLADLSRTDP
jgi:hypothetical protein